MKCDTLYWVTSHHGMEFDNAHALPKKQSSIFKEV